MRHRLQSQAPGARASGSPGHLSSAQGASRSSSVGRLLSDVATTAEPSIVESALGSACACCAGGADEPGDMPDHGRTREPGDDGVEVSAANQVSDAQSSVLRGAQTNSLSVAGPGRHQAAVAPTSLTRSPSRARVRGTGDPRRRRLMSDMAYPGTSREWGPLRHAPVPIIGT
jgi:hypothetical protein